MDDFQGQGAKWGLPFSQLVWRSLADLLPVWLWTMKVLLDMAGILCIPHASGFEAGFENEEGTSALTAQALGRFKILSIQVCLSNMRIP